MTVQSRTERRFDRSSPVARYWLAQCEGFHVKGPVTGIVEKVVGSAAEQSAESLVVRSGWRRHTIQVDSVDAVVPAARLIVVQVAPPSHHRSRSLAQGGSRAAGAVAATVTDRAPPLARFARDAVMTLALLIAAGIIMVIRTLAFVVVRATQLITNAVASPATRRRPP
jgi:hypothetical protein